MLYMFYMYPPFNHSKPSVKSPYLCVAPAFLIALDPQQVIDPDPKPHIFGSRFNQGEGPRGPGDLWIVG